MNDSLTQILERLKQAAEAEDYAAAAKLRDASLAYIGGWWRPVSSPQARGVNSSSSLLHVAHTEPDRWTGMLFTPADFMQFDLEGNCSASELQMSDMLQEARYGTPLFEVFVLPEQQQQQQAQESSAMPAQAAAAGAPQPASSSGGASTGYRPVVVALQSVNRAFNELLGVQPARRRTAPTSTDGSRFINQRLLLMVQPHTVTAAAVHAGNSATLWTWHANRTPSSTISSDTTSPPAAAAASAATTAAAAAAGAECSVVQGPFRPAELSGGVRQGLTVDWHTIDHLRGPGTLQRTGTDTLTFCRQPLPADVLSVLGSSSNGSSSGWDGSNARVFRVDLQYQLAPSAAEAEAAAPSAPDSSNSSSGDSEPAASAAAVAESSVAAAAAAAAGGGDGASWAVRVAAELNSLLAAPPHAAAAEEGGASQQQGSNDSSRLQDMLAALLAAAAEGTAPPGGAASEHQQAASVVEVAVGDAAAAAAAPVEFTRVSEPTASLSFGGWQVTVCL